jgi:nitrogen-specific signal transduction histidine kinase
VKVFEKKLGQILIDEGKVRLEDLESALSIQKQTSQCKLLGGILIELSLISKDDLDLALNRQLLYSSEENRFGLDLSDEDRIKKIADKYRESEFFEELNELIGVITHKIRNPLSGISAAVEVLREKVGASDTNEKFFKMIFKEIDSLEKVAKDLFREFSHK